jgi:hypothetical protein
MLNYVVNFFGANLYSIFFGMQNLENQRILKFSECKFITKIPDISRISNLEELCVSRCKSLVEVHDSVGFLDKLIVLSCSNLINLPRSLKLRSLKNLDLEHCLRLENFPKIECKMECLRRLQLSTLL